MYKRKRSQTFKVSKQSHIESVPLQTTRMDVPDDNEELGVHKVPFPNDFENGNVYEIP